MKLDKIILELKKVKTGEQELDSVISVLEKELMKSKFTTTVGKSSYFIFNDDSDTVTRKMKVAQSMK